MAKRYYQYGLMDVDIESIVRSQDLIYEDAATCWQDGHILGNGNVGAVCYAPYWLEWTVNKIDVFDSRMAPVKRLSHGEVMEEMKKRGAKNLGFLEEIEKPPASYQGPREPLLKSCGQIKVRTSSNEYSWGAPPPYKIRQVLSLWEGKDYMEMELHSSQPRVRSFVYRRSNLLIIRMRETSGPMWGKHVELCRPYDADIKPPVFGQEKNLRWFTQELPDGSSYAMVMGALPVNTPRRKEMKKSRISDTELFGASPVSPKGDRTWFNLIGDFDLFVSVASSHETQNPLQKAREIVLEGIREGADKLEAEHTKWWDEFWRKSFIQYPDPMLEQLWYIGLYQAGSSLNHTPIPGLFGLWYGYHDLPRQGFFFAVYTLDQNIQLTTLPVLGTNHPELAEPFMDTFLNALPKTISETKRQFSLPGAYFPLEMAFLGGEPPFGSSYRYTFCGGPFSGQVFVWAYRYTKDIKLLREKIYPFIREVVRFFRAFMKKGEDGKYFLPPTVPAEIFTLSRNSIDVLSLLKPCLIMAIEASKKLNVDKEERKHWEDLLKRYPSYPIKDGIIVDGQDIDLKHPSHHTFRLYPLIFGNEAGKEVRKTLNYITPKFKKGKRWSCSGWPWFFFTLTKLKLGMKKDILPLLYEEISQLKPNGLFPHFSINRGPLANPRSSELIVATPELNSAVMMIITEMFMQSYNDLIRLFPGVKGKITARFGNLRAEGAFLVSSEMVKGKVKFVSVHSEKGGKLRLQNPWPSKVINFIRKNGNKEKLKGDIISLDLKKGESVTLSCKGKLKTKKIISTQKACPKLKMLDDGTVIRLGKKTIIS